MRDQLLLSAIFVLAGADDSSCHNSKKEFLCDDVPLHIMTKNTVDSREHYYMAAASDHKSAYVDKKKKELTMQKKGSKYYLEDKDYYLRAREGKNDVDFTNRKDDDAEWKLDYDHKNPDRFTICTDVTGKSKNNHCLAYADRHTNVKLLESGNSGDRELWYIDPAFCAVIDSDNIFGYWTTVGNEIDKPLPRKDFEKQGYNIRVDGTFHDDFSYKLKKVMKGGFHVMDEDAEGGASSKVTSKLAEHFSADIDVDLTTYKETKYEVKWTKKDKNLQVWQFVLSMTDSCGQETTVYTAHKDLNQGIILTPGDTTENRPCCLPGNFANGAFDKCLTSDAVIPDKKEQTTISLQSGESGGGHGLIG